METYKMSIKTNRHYYPIYTYDELPKKWQKEYQEYRDNDYRYVIYKKECYLDEFLKISEQMVLTHPVLRDWDGYMSDSYFSGIVCRYHAESDSYQLGTYFV